MHATACDGACTQRSRPFLAGCVNVKHSRSVERGFAHTAPHEARVISSCRPHLQLQNAVLLALFGALSRMNELILCRAATHVVGTHDAAPKLQNTRSYATRHQTGQATRIFAAEDLLFKIAAAALGAPQRRERACALIERVAAAIPPYTL